MNRSVTCNLKRHDECTHRGWIHFEEPFLSNSCHGRCECPCGHQPTPAMNNHDALVVSTGREDTRHTRRWSIQEYYDNKPTAEVH